MFRRLPAAEHTESQLRQLLGTMRDDPAAAGGWGGAPPDPRAGDNPRIPAGYTYFGQFVDHDITFDPASDLQRANDPDSLVNFRSPRFDLDSLYGSGPKDEPFQYDKASGGTKLLVETNGEGVEDLPRNREGVALIGDPRNDENTIVSQLQLVFLKFHNRVVDHLADQGTAHGDALFRQAQQLVRWHYQWVVVHDFLPRIVGQDLVNQLWPLTDGQRGEMKLRFYKWTKNPYMPVEFAAAAYRYGHSQVRAEYDLNATVTKPLFLPGDQVGATEDLRGFRPLPAGWTVEWPRFLEIDGSQPQPSRNIDTKLATALFDLPGLPGGEVQSLAERNLRRGAALGLPSGEGVARAMGLEPLTEAETGSLEPTPLWFYVLKEAEVRAGGQCLGPVGGRIVAEVLLGLLRADPNGFYAVDPTWKPSLPAVAGPGTFTLADLAAFATGLT